jgi:hypothetical protein
LIDGENTGVTPDITEFAIRITGQNFTAITTKKLDTAGIITGKLL